MRKISEIIKITLPLHANAGQYSVNSTGLCFAMNEARRKGDISADEYHACKEYITYNVLIRKGVQYGYLRDKLKAAKKANNLEARVAYYQRLVIRLEKKGL